MIWVRLAGGLGNQLFQLAAAREVQKKIAAPIKIFYYHLANYNTVRPYLLPEILNQDLATGDLPFSKRFIVKYRINKILPLAFPWYINSNNLYKAAGKNDWVLDDYFQDLQHIQNGVEAIAEDIRRSVAIRKDLLEIMANLAGGLKVEELAAVHIRRGDYLKKENIKVFHVQDDDYYKTAIKALPDAVKKIVVFSEAEEDGFKHISDVQTISVKQYKLNDVDEFLLMCLFKHFIIANSTYSYWAAIVGASNHSTLIGPKNWTYKPNENITWNTNLKRAAFVLI